MRAVISLLFPVACVACTESAGESERELPSPDPAVACVSAPLGVLTGTAHIRHSGSSGADETTADVTWTPAGTTGCVDRYVPSGRVTHINSSGVGNGGADLTAGDGELLVDRGAAPATYTMRGTSAFGTWTDHRGSFDGGVTAGGVIDEADVVTAMRWHFVRADAAFGEPASGCSEPAIDRWTTTSEQAHNRATVTWTRASTDGCVDTFRPSGTVEALARETAYCASLVIEPARAAIGAEDGVLVIDRSTDPATYRIEGRTVWTAQRTCTTHDGTVEQTGNLGGGRWAHFQAAFDGAHFAGGFADGEGTSSWEFSRP